MSNFDAAEIFRFAVRIEENGEKLYRRAASISDDEKTRYMFNFLADQEIKHKEFFGNILRTLDFSAFPYETYPGEYVEYMRNYLDRQKIFNEKNEKDSLGISDIISAVNFAIDRESDSILFYSEIKNLVPEKQQGKVDEIIYEERRHFVMLSDFKKEISK